MVDLMTFWPSMPPENVAKLIVDLCNAEKRIARQEAALKLIAACTPIPGPGFSLVLSMTSVAQKALE